MTFSKINYSRRIPPCRSNDGWQKNEINTSHPAHKERLVPVAMCSEYSEVLSFPFFFGGCGISPWKVGELNGALYTPFVRESVAKGLVELNDNLPEGYMLVTIDAYRPKEVQNALFVQYKNKLKTPEYGGLSEEAAVAATTPYVSVPSEETSPHMTGNAVDVAVVKFDKKSFKKMQALNRKLKELQKKHPGDFFVKEIIEIEMQRYKLLREKGVLLNMGVRISEVKKDEAGRPITDLRYLEVREEEALAEKGPPLLEKEREALINRRILNNAAVAAGFEIYAKEYWHLGYVEDGKGNKFQPPFDGTLPCYGYIELSPENIEHERKCLRIFEESVRSYESKTLPEEKKKPRRAFKDVAFEMFGNPFYRNPKNPVSPPIGPVLVKKASLI